MSTINDSDLLLVERNGNLHQITYDQMSTLNDDDILLVERGGVQYKVEAQYVSTGANGLIIPPVEVLTPINGAGITEFDQYEPLSSAITAVGEAGTIAKETDEILSVSDEVLNVDVTLDPSQNINNDTFSNGNLTVTTNTGSYGTYTSTVATPLSGKWYAEVEVVSTGDYLMLGLVDSNSTFHPQAYPSQHNGVVYYSYDGSRWIDGAQASYGGTFFAGNIIGIAYDADNGTVTFYLNGASQGVITGVPVREYYFAGGDLSSTASGTQNWNFGQNAWVHQPPSGYLGLTFTGNKVLSFPTNTNFSGLSVGDLVKGGTVESPVMIATSTLGGTDFVVENFETVDTSSTSVQTPSTFDHGSRVKHLCFYLSDATSDVQVNMGGTGWVTYSSVDGVNWVQGTTHGGGSALVRTLSSNNPSAKYFLIGGLTAGDLFSTWSTFEFQSSFVSNWNPPYTIEMPVGGSITPGVEITAIDASGPSQTDVYATFDPDSFNANQGTMSNGNLTLNASGSYYIEGRSTIDAFSVDNYSELTVTAASGSDSFAYGIGDADAWIISGVGSYFIYRENGSIISYPGNTTVATVDSYTQGDVLGMAVDSTNVKFYKNGALQGTYAHGKSGTFYVYAMNVPNTGSAQLDINFGATAFTHTAPSGYAGLSETVTTYPNVTVDGGDWDTSNQSQVWSSNITGTIRNPERAFNGVIGEDPEIATAHGGEEFTINFSTPISGALEIRGGDYGAGGSTAVATCSDGTVFPIGNAAWPNFQWFGPENVSNVTSIAFTQPNGGGISLSAIRLDGKLLVDAIEDSQVWSNGFSGTNHGSSPIANAFDGSLSNIAYSLLNNTSTVTLPGGSLTLDTTSSLRVYGLRYGGTSTFFVNGNDYTNQINNAVDWYTITGETEVTSISIGNYNNGNDYTGLYAIEVNGKLLVDAGIRDFGDRKLSSSIPYEKSLTFTDDTQLANMVGPLEMTDANGDVVTPVSDTIANVSGNVLTLQGDTNLAYFQPGDEVQTGVQVVSVDAAAPSITVDGGSWYGADGTGGTYEISRSLRFNSADSAYLSRTPSSAGNRKTWTWSGWVKRSKLSSGNQHIFDTNNPYTGLYFTGSDGLNFRHYIGGTIWSLSTNRQFRDASAWYHIVVNCDTTQAVDSDRLAMYINGVKETNFATSTYPSLDYQSEWNNSSSQYIGQIAGSGYFDGYLADVHFVDGQALEPTAFGDFDSNGVWQAKEFGGNHNTPAGGTINTIEITGNGPHGFHAIRVDGTILTGDDYTNGTLGSWSSNISNGHKSFDGSLAGPDVSTSTNGQAIIWTSNGGLNFTDKVEIYVGGVSPFYVNLDGAGAGSALNIHSWNTIAEAPAAGVNGFHLDFSDSSSDAALGYDAAGSNDWTVNNLSAPPSNTGLYASNFVSSNGFNASYPAMNAFDGSTSTYAQATATGGNITFTPSTPIAYSSSIKINMPSADATASVNGGSAVSVANSSETTIATGSGTLTSLVLTASNLPGLLYIKIDDQILVNSGLDSGTDSLVDTPTNYGNDTGAGGEVRGSYATLNPLNTTYQTLSNGNLGSTGISGRSTGTIYVNSGKWYWEFTAGTNYTMAGIESSTNTFTSYSGGSDQQYALFGNAGSGQLYHNGSASSFDGFVSGDVIGVALDMDGGNLYFYKNGVVMNSGTAAATGLTGSWTANCRSGSGAYDGETVFNFGQRPFAYAAPSGYKALCTTNLPEPTIEDGSKHFDVVTFTGSSSGGSFTIPNFEPDLIWCKNRDGSKNHILQDSVRGFGDYKSLYSNLTLGNDGNNGGTNNIMSVSGSTVNYGTNDNFTGNMVAWAWNAGDTTETIAADSLTSSVYDQSQTWSSLLISPQWSNVHPPTGAFDGLTSGISNGNGSLANYTGNWSVDFTQDPTLQPTGEITLYTNAQEVTGSNSTSRVYLTDSNGRRELPVFKGYWSGGTQPTTHTINGVATLLEIEKGGGNDSLYVAGIEVNGKLLVDSGVSVDAVPSVASEVRANPTAGFSVVKYTGDGSQSRVAHGLGKAPELVITKATSASSRWAVQMPTIIGGNYYLELNSTTAKQSWGSQTLNDPTSTTFDTVYANGVNESGVEYVGYCFAPVEGYSSIGSYIGNGSADGPFVHTGFKIRFLLYRRTDVGSNWYIMDTERDPDNPATQRLLAESSNAEYTYSSTDLLDANDNGFKVRSSNNAINANGGTYIYYAVAENPVNTTPEVDTSGDTQVALDPLAAIATEIVETDGTTMYLNGATGPWRTGLSIEGSQINADPPGPNEITFTSQNQGTPAFSGVDATLASRTWTLESGTTATGPWTLVDTYSDFGVLNTQTGATPWTENKPTLQPNTYYRIKVQYNSTNAESVESVYNTFKTGDA